MTRYHLLRGFTYIALLIALAIAGVTLSAIGVMWHTAQQRDREEELIYVGDQIRTAIGRYYSAAGGARREYPNSLDDLLRDPRQPGVVRYLRKRYYDPITGKNEWGVVKDEGDRVVGVFSLSDDHPIKQTNFSWADRDFEKKEHYSEWLFIYLPRHSRTVHLYINSSVIEGDFNAN